MRILCRPLKVKEGQPHPDLIVETASLAAIEPPDPHYRHHLQVQLSMLKTCCAGGRGQDVCTGSATEGFSMAGRGCYTGHASVLCGCNACCDQVVVLSRCLRTFDSYAEKLLQLQMQLKSIPTCPMPAAHAAARSHMHFSHGMSKNG